MGARNLHPFSRACFSKSLKKIKKNMKFYVDFLLFGFFKKLKFIWISLHFLCWFSAFWSCFLKKINCRYLNGFPYYFYVDCLLFGHAFWKKLTAEIFMDFQWNFMLIVCFLKIFMLIFCFLKFYAFYKKFMLISCFLVMLFEKIFMLISCFLDFMLFENLFFWFFYYLAGRHLLYILVKLFP